MRIAFLVNSFPPPITGGAGRIAELQVELLKAAGHDVAIFKPDMSWLQESALMRLFHHLGDLLPDNDFVARLRAFDPDVLITHNLTGCGFATPKTIRKAKSHNSKVKWVHVLHDVQLFAPSGQIKNANRITLGQRLWSNLRRRALGRPDLVISPTAWLLEEHRRRGLFLEGHVEVLPNPGPEPSLVTRLPHEPIELLFVGRVSDDKGAELLLRLLDALEDRARLTLVGSGDKTHVFSNRSNVKLLGQLEPGAVREAMRRADILLVPSQIAENQPTVILEAASVGLPVLASDMGGIRETLGETGRVLLVNDAQAWVQMIGELVEPSIYREASAAMYDLARRYEPKAYAETLKFLLQTRLS